MVARGVRMILAGAGILGCSAVEAFAQDGVVTTLDEPAPELTGIGKGELILSTRPVAAMASVFHAPPGTSECAARFSKTALGKTPVVWMGHERTSHLVSVEADGYRRWCGRIEVKGQTRRRLTLALQRSTPGNASRSDAGDLGTQASSVVDEDEREFRSEWLRRREAFVRRLVLSGVLTTTGIWLVGTMFYVLSKPERYGYGYPSSKCTLLPCAHRRSYRPMHWLLLGAGAAELAGGVFALTNVLRGPWPSDTPPWELQVGQGAVSLSFRGQW